MAMTAIKPPAPQDSVFTYIRAKDENRPYLMSRAFADTATLEIVAKAGTLSFPPMCHGLESITDVLVRDFARKFENVHTLCLGIPPCTDDKVFSCRWLVGMSEKETRDVRVGSGRYDWTFRADSLVEHLKITIDLMQTLPPADVAVVMKWLSPLPYPWCPVDRALGSAPKLDALTTVFRCIAAA